MKDHALQGIFSGENSAISQSLVNWDLPPIYDEYTEEGFLIVQRYQDSDLATHVMTIVECPKSSNYDGQRRQENYLLQKSHTLPSKPVSISKKFVECYWIEETILEQRTKVFNTYGIVHGFQSLFILNSEVKVVHGNGTETVHIEAMAQKTNKHQQEKLPVETMSSPDIARMLENSEELDRLRRVQQEVLLEINTIHDKIRSEPNEPKRRQLKADSDISMRSTSVENHLDTLSSLTGEQVAARVTEGAEKDQWVVAKVTHFARESGDYVLEFDDDEDDDGFLPQIVVPFYWVVGLPEGRIVAAAHKGRK
ncbi:hypothetical protein Vadar_004619 [Vaccinium darrowii]|uniref:Uncharacterized protein n=1 Tax=Vaccinium darrowii TaxID=229202 RepID=A0ACB7YCS0_9ERIC|nr:hypothetical protein Vadar_004619 [Vaccinium darrowii]